MFLINIYEYDSTGWYHLTGDLHYDSFNEYLCGGINEKEKVRNAV